MNTTYQVRSNTGSILGIFPSLAGVRDLMDQHPGSTAEPVVSIDNACAAHPAYEADNCPACGTSQVI